MKLLNQQKINYQSLTIKQLNNIFCLSIPPPIKLSICETQLTHLIHSSTTKASKPANRASQPGRNQKSTRKTHKNS